MSEVVELSGHEKAVKLAMQRVADRRVTHGAADEDAATLAQEVSILRQYRDEVDQLRVQLAGCGVAALGCTGPEQLAKHGDYGWSASYQDVLDMRRKLDAAIAQIVQADICLSLERAAVRLYQLRRDILEVGAAVTVVEALDETCDQLEIEAKDGAAKLEELRWKMRQAMESRDLLADPPGQ